MPSHLLAPAGGRPGRGDERAVAGLQGPATAKSDQRGSRHIGQNGVPSGNRNGSRTW